MLDQRLGVDQLKLDYINFKTLGIVRAVSLQAYCLQLYSF